MKTFRLQPAKNFRGISGKRRFTAWCLLALFATSMASAQVVINEILADNETAIPNGSAHPDYLELYNPSSQAVSLAGLSLTDDPLQPRQFVFPAGVTLPARSFIRVWCDTNSAVTGWRANFGLGSDGDTVRLYAANGFTVLDEVTFGLQVPDLSIGRIPNGTGPWTLNRPSPMGPNEAEPLAAPTQLRLNEWMAKPASGDDWLEVFNGDSRPVSLAGLVITDTAIGTPGNRAIPALSFIGGRGFARFLASDLEKPDADHLDFKLSTSGETLTIYAANRVTILDRVVFGSQVDNMSQGRAPDGSDHIVYFPIGRATPDEPNFAGVLNIVISEVLSHTDPPLEDAIELHNPTATSVDISHWWLSDSGKEPKKYRIPAGTIIPAGGFKVFYAYQIEAGATGFTLDSAEGDEVYLSVGDAAGNLTGEQVFAEFGALKNGVSAGRHRTSVGVDFVPLSQRTFGVDIPSTVTQFRQGSGRTNALPRVGPLVITEIMYHPPDVDGQSNTDDEFIELHNPSPQPVPLYDAMFPTNRWRLREGVQFDFPPNVVMPPGAFLLVVGFDPVTAPAQLAAFRTRYSVPAAVPVLGPYDGKLSDTGEGIRLLWPDAPQGPDKPDYGYVPYEQVERIKYLGYAPWPSEAAGTGRSLQRRENLEYANEPLNWFAALPTAGRPAMLDSDADGLPDDWENAHGLNPFSSADAHLDPDGDRTDNREEYWAGTDPQDAHSVLEIRAFKATAGGLILRLHAVAGRHYSIQSTDRLDGAPWSSVTDFTAGTSGEVQVPLPPGTGNGSFFRLSVSSTP